MTVCVKHSLFFTVHKIWIINGVDSTHCFSPLDFYCTECSVCSRNVFNVGRFFRQLLRSLKPVALNICKMMYLHASTVNRWFVFSSCLILYFNCLLSKEENCNFHIVQRYIPISVHDCRLYDCKRFLAFCQTKPKICVKRIEPTIAAGIENLPAFVLRSFGRQSPVGTA